MSKILKKKKRESVEKCIRNDAGLYGKKTELDNPWSFHW